jgi:hypothetical protein
LVVTGKLVGQFVQRVDVRHSHVLLSDDWLALRRDIMTALRKHPAAIRDVIAMVQAREGVAAKQINPPAEPVVIDVTPNFPPCPVPLP